MKTEIQERLKQEPSHRLYNTILTCLFTLTILWAAFSLNLTSPKADSLEIAGNIIKGILTPDLDFLFDFQSQTGVPFLLFETLSIAFLGTIFGSLLAIPFSFLMAENIVGPYIAAITRLLVVAIRTIPAMVYGLMFVAVSGQGPMTGVLTMSLTSIGMVSKLYVDIIEELDKGVLESMTSMGCTNLEKIRFGILPQLAAAFLSVTIYRFDMNLRDTTTLGLVGAGGIGAPLIFAMNAFKWQEVGAILIGLIILILLVEVFSNRIRKRLVNG